MNTAKCQQFLGLRAVLTAIALAAVTSVAAGCGGVDARPQDASLAQDFADASEFQRAMYADGVISFEEYERSVLGTVDCLRGKGFRIAREPYPSPGQRLRYSFEAGVTDDDLKRADAAFEACYKEFQDVVDVAWAHQTAPDEATMQAARAALMQCLRDGGYDTTQLPPNPVGTEWRPARSHPSWPDCQQRVAQEYDLAGFGG